MPEPPALTARHLHPTVEACVSREFCDVTFQAAERRRRAIDYLIDHIHEHEHPGSLANCRQCREIHTAALNLEHPDA